MICYFCLSQDTQISLKDADLTHKYIYFGVPDKNQLYIDRVYFTTPSNYYEQLNILKKELGEKADEVMFAVDPEHIQCLSNFPKQIGFGKIDSDIEGFREKKELKIAIINAMSNSIGDHLIGMQAFDQWYSQLQQKLPETKIDITFFQHKPCMMAEITMQSPNVRHLYVLPSNIDKLMTQDAFVDMGTLLLRDGFDTENMMDFFLSAFSLDPKEIHSSQKRIKYTIDSDSLWEVQKELKSIKQPTLLLHHKASSVIRSLPDDKAKWLVEQLIEKTDYHIVCTSGLEFTHPRFTDLTNFSTCISRFSGIISQVDNIITVDTCTYHIADAFSTPTVVLFSTIDPDLRCRYYPFVEPIMYETKDGKLFGKHKLSIEDEEKKKELDHLNKLWDKIDVDKILSKLHSIKEHHGRS